MTKVLIFENDPSFAVELRAELSALGCTVQVFDDGNTGLIAAATQRPDLILLSVELPRINGFSICNKIKKDPQLNSVPLIILSSESTPETFEQHSRLPTRAQDYVRKPIVFNELLGRIEQFVPIERGGSDIARARPYWSRMSVSAGSRTGSANAAAVRRPSMYCWIRRSTGQRWSDSRRACSR